MISRVAAALMLIDPTGRETSLVPNATVAMYLQMRLTAMRRAVAVIELDLNKVIRYFELAREKGEREQPSTMARALDGTNA